MILSPLAEGRELKLYHKTHSRKQVASPLAEGRELKLRLLAMLRNSLDSSPLAEGRELKLCRCWCWCLRYCRPSRRGVN